MTLRARLLLYARLTRLNKPIGILLLAWPTLWGLWFAADGVPPLSLLVTFVVGVILMRSAGCAINDYADRHFDGHVERTRNRPLATGEIKPQEAVIVALVLTLLALLLIVPILTPLLAGLAILAAFLAASYPFTKRFLAIPQAYLGIAFGFGIPMAYAAIQGTVPAEAWLLLLANMFWSIAYDTEYAMVDRADDLKIGIRTAAITLGRFDVAAIMCCYAATLGLLAWVGRDLGTAYFAGLTIAAGIAVYHYTLIRQRDPARCFKAFLHNTWFGAAVFVGLVSLDLGMAGA
ncbi:MAG: 4-hydroxybenzoate octaprenyltransferase [Betaproteobacteria bacterium]|nr:MAG: 4-hydroxybenzoate octaprenyltransferase [Betaproteobacteria bacterium]